MCILHGTKHKSQYIPPSGVRANKKCACIRLRRYFLHGNVGSGNQCTDETCDTRVPPITQIPAPAHVICDVCWAEIMMDRVMGPVLAQISDPAEVTRMRALHRQVVEEEYKEGPKTFHISAGSLYRILMRVLPPALTRIPQAKLGTLDAGYTKPAMSEAVLHLLRNTHRPYQIEGIGWSVTDPNE